MTQLFDSYSFDIHIRIRIRNLSVLYAYPFKTDLVLNFDIRIHVRIRSLKGGYGYVSPLSAPFSPLHIAHNYVELTNFQSFLQFLTRKKILKLVVRIFNYIIEKCKILILLSFVLIIYDAEN